VSTLLDDAETVGYLVPTGIIVSGLSVAGDLLLSAAISVSGVNVDVVGTSNAVGDDQDVVV
jgi:hypothetical protein